MSDSSSGLNLHAAKTTKQAPKRLVDNDQELPANTAVLYIYTPLPDETLVNCVMNKTGVSYRLNDYRIGTWSAQHRLCFFRFEALSAFQQRLLRDAKQQQATVTPLTDYFEAHFGCIEVDLLGPEQLLEMDQKTLKASSKQYSIRTLVDKTLALAALLLILPVAIMAAAAIKLDSAGSVFFRQQRTGLHNREFQILKFRSMTQDAERNGAQWASIDDARITRVGWLLRKTRFDELPQLVNVLKGDMTLIGPRPEREVFIRELEDEVPFYRFRHLVKPGITGLAQVSAGYGASVEDAREKHRHDLYYIKHQNLWLDLKIIAKTLQIVLTGKGI